MADIVDLANAQSAIFVEHQVARSRKPTGPTPTGRCHYCDAEAGPADRFCDSACRDDYEAEQAAKLRNGARDGA